MKRNLSLVPLRLVEFSLWRKDATKSELPCRGGNNLSPVSLGSLLEAAASAALSSDAASHSSPGKQIDGVAGSGYLWLPAQSPGHSKAPPSTWPVTSDPDPVANTGVGEVGRVSVSGCLGPGHKWKSQLFPFLLLPCEVLGAAELVFLQIAATHMTV